MGDRMRSHDPRHHARTRGKAGHEPRGIVEMAAPQRCAGGDAARSAACSALIGDRPVADGAPVAIDPAPSTLHRLTQAQYTNALHDLLGRRPVVVPAALEPDLVVAGFATVGGSVGSVSRRGVEQYETAGVAGRRAGRSPRVRRARRAGGLHARGHRRRDLPAPPAPSSARLRPCRAWRRHLAAAGELDRITGVATGRGEHVLGDFYQGLGFGILALLEVAELPLPGRAGSALRPGAPFGVLPLPGLRARLAARVLPLEHHTGRRPPRRVPARAGSTPTRASASGGRPPARLAPHARRGEELLLRALRPGPARRPLQGQRGLPRHERRPRPLRPRGDAAPRGPAPPWSRTGALPGSLHHATAPSSIARSRRSTAWPAPSLDGFGRGRRCRRSGAAARGARAREPALALCPPDLELAHAARQVRAHGPALRDHPQPPGQREHRAPRSGHGGRAHDAPRPRLAAHESQPFWRGVPQARWTPSASGWRTSTGSGSSGPPTTARPSTPRAALDGAPFATPVRARRRRRCAPRSRPVPSWCAPARNGYAPRPPSETPGEDAEIQRLAYDFADQGHRLPGLLRAVALSPAFRTATETP